MDQDWRALATRRAEYVSDRIRGLLSSGLDFLRLELGVDLGLKPEQCPSWLILSAALIGLTVLVLLAACGRRKRRVSPVTVSPSTAVAEIPVKTALPPKTVKTEPSEPKKKNKKKAAEKQKAQANGQTVTEPQEEIKVIQEKKKKPPPPAAPAPVSAPAQPPADTKTKKNKKKPKPEVKPTQYVSSTDGKEPDEGAWETKVSNREKRQQRKKEKGPGDSSGSPVGGDRASQKVEQPALTAPAGTKKNKESSRAKASKGDAIIAPVTSNCKDVSTVNGGGWTEIPVKSTQTNALNNKKLSVGRKTPGLKNHENSTWKQEPEGPWTGLDSRIKAEPKPVNMLRLNPSGGETGTKSNSDNGLWDSKRISEWSSLNGLPTGDSSDWNAPTELWENYEDPKGNAPVLKEMPVSKPLVLQESNDDKDKTDPAGVGKSKRRKKKKRPEEVGSAAEMTQVGSAPAEKIMTVKPHPPHVPKDETSKQNIPPQSQQKKSDQNWEPPKQVQKKKARKET
ncbi:protein LYRIC isoform X2 [Carassius gibelio]|uniref:protein LYRIC isoform X2 n=1 Tax=Carassius gibelio TaxID=101364 RepID=UPI002279C42D|nr:protein LYRIC isoform X2 [Carassius gibelio]